MKLLGVSFVTFDILREIRVSLGSAELNIVAVSDVAEEEVSDDILSILEKRGVLKKLEKKDCDRIRIALIPYREIMNE